MKVSLVQNAPPSSNQKQSTYDPIPHRTVNNSSQ